MRRNGQQRGEPVGRKKSSGGVEILFTLISAVLVGLVAFIGSLFKALSDDGVRKSMQRRDLEVGTALPRASVKKMKTQVTAPVVDDITFEFSGTGEASVGHNLPKRSTAIVGSGWYRAGEAVEVAGRLLPGGLIYVGSSLPVSSGGNDPCLIDPKRKVAPEGDFTVRQMDYWPSYSSITPTARAAYLNWLAAGRRAPDADVGFVFLFFYGLERRVLRDAANDSSVKSEFPAIAQELRELLAVYGQKSGSFNAYASNLLSWLESTPVPPRLYERRLGAFARSYELPLPVRLALAQASADRAPIPSHLALAWIRTTPQVLLRTPASRCASEFERLFHLRYTDKYGAGMVIPPNRTKLRYSYRAASAAFRTGDEIRLELGDLPDVSMLTGPFHALRALADPVCDELDAYSRVVGKNPDARESVDGLMLLPPVLWPQSLRPEFDALVCQVAHGPHETTLQSVLDAANAKGAVTKERVAGLARALSSFGVGLEPDPRYGSKAPKVADLVILFSLPASAVDEVSPPPAYKAALLTLQLASAVAIADGDFCDAEMDHLHKQVDAWTHLSEAHRCRLRAQILLLRKSPVQLSSLTKHFEPLDTATRAMLAGMMASVAQADGVVAPAEVKTLEKVYKALGVDGKKLFSDLHAVAAGGQTVTKAQAETSGFRLDATRIAALQKDTERVSALLSSIFQEDEAPPAASEQPPEPEATVVAPAEEAGLLGLDESHSALARLLLTRNEWTRADLLDAAADLDLMLDGALEQINEAAFDKFDIPFSEGEDPLLLNLEIVEKFAA